MRVKVSEAEGPVLDWMVAKCEGYALQLDDEVSGPWLVPQDGYLHDEKPLSLYRPSISWAQGGPIIEREHISVWETCGEVDPQKWSAITDIKTWGEDWHLERNESFGHTALVAAMRCYVVSKLGTEVEVPDELA